jgi:Family of unknown function (DUF6232)
MAETVFFDENNVQVTNARFVVSGQTYAMNGVTSVKSVREIQNPSRIFPIIMGLAGLISLQSSPLIGILLIAAAVAIWILIKSKTTDTVVLSTSGGEVKALSSEDIGRIQRIVTALNDAIIHRG